MKKVVKSLCIIAAVDVGGWFLTPGLILCIEITSFDGMESVELSD